MKYLIFPAIAIFSLPGFFALFVHVTQITPKPIPTVANCNIKTGVVTINQKGLSPALIAHEISYCKAQVAKNN